MNIRETDIYEEGRNDGIALGITQGIAQGAEQKAIETARNFLNEGLFSEQVARCTGLPIETVEQLAKEQSNQNQRKIQG